MYHSVYFGNMNSFSDWHLVPDGRQVISSPEIETMVVDVPGAEGTVDLSEVITKYPIYKNRTGSLKFHVLDTNRSWIDLYEEILATLHGKQTTLTLEEDPDWYYKGRFTVKWTSNNNGSLPNIEIGYTLDPFKYYKTINTITETLSSSSKSYTIFKSIRSFPVIPTVNITANTTTGLTFSVTNSEIVLSNVSMKPISSTGTFPLYSCVLSNMTGNNTGCILKASRSSGSATYTISYNRVML